MYSVHIKRILCQLATLLKQFIYDPKMNQGFPMLVILCCCMEDIIGIYLINICYRNSGNIF